MVRFFHFLQQFSRVGVRGTLFPRVRGPDGTRSGGGGWGAWGPWAVGAAAGGDMSGPVGDTGSGSEGG